MKREREDRTYWRSVERLLDSPAVGPELVESVRQEFPDGADLPPDGVTRRSMLQLMGASFALAGLASCRRPVEHIVPYSDAPEGIVPGIPQRFATTMPLGTSAYGAVVESHEGRPTKVEGNELHPSSLGATNLWMQASLLDLYDPDRARRVRRGGEEADLEQFLSWWTERAAVLAEEAGGRLAILATEHCSPTQARLEAAVSDRFPQARVIHWASVSDRNIVDGWQGRPVYDLERADVVCALDDDLLLTASDSVLHGRGFAAARDPDSGSVGRLYVIEPTPTVTGANADHRLALRRGDVSAFVAALAVEVGVDAGDLSEDGLTEATRRRAATVARDLERAGDRALVTAGRAQPPSVQRVVRRIDERLGAVGSTVTVETLGDVRWGGIDGLSNLVEEMRAGEVTTVVVLGGDPAATAPADVELAAALSSVDDVVHLATMARDDGDAEGRSGWRIPAAHYLESWSDALAPDGTPSVVQPLIAPLFDGVSAIELLGIVVGDEIRPGYELVRETWDTRFTDGSDRAWRQTLHDGVLSIQSSPPTPSEGGAAGGGVSEVERRPQAESSSTEMEAAGGADPGAPVNGEPSTGNGSVTGSVAGQPADTGRAAGRDRENGPAAGQDSDSRPAGGAYELTFIVSPSLYDGRFANNAWLQELPDPITKITWDNPARVSPRTAAELGVETGDHLRIGVGDRSVELPAIVVPGQADGAIAVELGYGGGADGDAGGRVGGDVGVDVSSLRRTDGFWFARAADVGVERTSGRTELASTQTHWQMEGRDLVRDATIEEYRNNPDFAQEPEAELHLGSLWDEHDYDERPQWGMQIDLNRCTGCNACVVACQSENNIPVVGPEQVREGREMHWLRVDRYVGGSADDPEFAFQPVPCMHCENAPCEQVCPVAATVHDDQGLNVMVYNRCIGTRYCSNNCPYKVRRFNFFNYTDDLPELAEMAMNPDVTVRSRGVMEKCTYCLQRITAGRRAADEEGRPIRDGEVQTACQQACPADAISFGDLLDADSEVRRRKEGSRDYTLLAELNNQPRTSYGAALGNPNPEWE